MRYYIRVQHLIIYNNIKGGYRDIKSPTWTLRLHYLLRTFWKFTRFSKSEDKTFCKRPFLMSWRWCLHEALPYVHQTNMSWKHSPTHGLTAFKGKIKKNFWLNKIFYRFFIEEKLFTKVLFSWYWRQLWQLLTNIICQCYISCLKLS